MAVAAPWLFAERLESACCYPHVTAASLDTRARKVGRPTQVAALVNSTSCVIRLARKHK